jgi:2-amino-4-hydroxy-6-hydroxymethyldihydropteridine diphosphokinase
MPFHQILISLGANTHGCWGAPSATLCRCSLELERHGIVVSKFSKIFRTKPHYGAGLMPAFYNAAAIIRTDLPLGSLLRRLKSIERRAGRRVSARWSARPLDIDIIDMGGRVLNWPALTRSGGPMILPHPLMHQRGFVLVPLAEIAPAWRHPVLGLTARELLARDPALRRGVTEVAECLPERTSGQAHPGSGRST